MLVRYLGAATLALQCAHAFRDASPFFLFSNTKLGTQHGRHSHVATSSSIESEILSSLSDCPSHSYVFVTQPGVSSGDFAAHQSTPHLERRLNGHNSQTSTTIKISNVVGRVETEKFASKMLGECSQTANEWSAIELDGTDGKVPHLEKRSQQISVSFSTPPATKDERAAALARNDAYLNDILAQLGTYTVVYATTPVSADAIHEIQHPDRPYEMDSPFPSGMHGDLKRDLSTYGSSSNGSNLDSNLPLFEKYQFVNQGIFITGSVSLILLIILYVGITAIAGLEVSYMAFSKEMGPAAQKKQQQQ